MRRKKALVGGGLSRGRSCGRSRLHAAEAKVAELEAECRVDEHVGAVDVA